MDHKPVARALLETVESLDSRTIQYIKPLTLVNSDSCVCVCVQERETKKGLVCVRVCACVCVHMRAELYDKGTKSWKRRAQSVSQVELSGVSCNRGHQVTRNDPERPRGVAGWCVSKKRSELPDDWQKRQKQNNKNKHINVDNRGKVLIQKWKDGISKVEQIISIKIHSIVKIFHISRLQFLMHHFTVATGKGGANLTHLFYVLYLHTPWILKVDF